MFYENLRRVCEEQGVKVTPTVLKCGGARGSITSWKNGASPNSSMVVRLANHLKVSTDYLLLGTSALSSDETELVEIFKELDDVGRVCVISEIYEQKGRIDAKKAVE